MIIRVSGWVLLLCAAAIASPAQVFTMLAQFNGTNGSGPAASLVEGMDAQLYGSTEYGGIPYNSGTIFRISPRGTLTSLLTLSNPHGSGDPAAALMLSPNRLLYGTSIGFGAGTIFSITPVGALATLHTFVFTDGVAPEGALIQAFNGVLYGTTNQGGTSQVGTIFKITPDGTLTTVHNFSGSDGASPIAGLVQGSNGLLYGTTWIGGANNKGTIYTISLGGAFTTLYSFSGSGDGGLPYGALIQGNDGNFYGAAEGAGNDGTVFRITPTGTLTTLHSFDQIGGSAPLATLTQGTDGNFYGATYFGGAGGEGEIYQITPSGDFTIVYSFGGTGGNQPVGGLVQHTDGAFYGTTSSGGSSQNGTIYRLGMGLGPFLKTLPAYGVVGSTVTILGSSLRGATITGVTFNGTAAAFTNLGAQGLTAIVPAGATTGTVQVTTAEATFEQHGLPGAAIGRLKAGCGQDCPPSKLKEKMNLSGESLVSLTVSIWEETREIWRPRPWRWFQALRFEKERTAAANIG